MLRNVAVLRFIHEKEEYGSFACQKWMNFILANLIVIKRCRYTVKAYTHIL